MNRKLILFILPLALIFSCNQGDDKNTDDAKTLSDNIKKMDIIENFFNNDNWMLIEHKDTSYFCFSRNGLSTKVYHYKMNKGDSVNTVVSKMNIDKDSVYWNFNDSIPLFLSSADDKRLEWKTIEGKQSKPYILYQKRDDTNIDVKNSSGDNFSLTKTLPLSAFLIRSRYDFLHGTRLAFSDTNFTIKRK